MIVVLINTDVCFSHSYQKPYNLQSMTTRLIVLRDSFLASRLGSGDLGFLGLGDEDRVDVR